LKLRLTSNELRCNVSSKTELFSLWPV
jgi:hypothetical protein